MKRRNLEDFEPGSLVQTPTGRYGIVTKHIYGADGDLPRCQIRYLDGSTRDFVRLQPDSLTLIAPGAKIFCALKFLNEATDDAPGNHTEKELAQD